MDIPKPNPGETCEQYTVRAHSTLIGSIPDPAERNAIVWKAWRDSSGPTKTEIRAYSTFGNSDYVPNSSVCYFVEHETMNSKGEPVLFTVGDLAEITQNNNFRIADRDAFSAISDNHTNIQDQSAEGDPEIFGYVGNYKLGMIGHENPKFAIFGDEYFKADKAAAAKNKPRRSVELITEHSTGQRYFDPIAAMAGRAPRLPLPPANFSQGFNETATITRYSVMAPESTGMLPGGANTFVQSTDYYDQQSESEEMRDSTLSDGDIRMILNAIGNMPQMQWVSEQMDAQNGGAVSPDAPGGMDDVGGPAEGDEFLQGDQMNGQQAPTLDGTDPMAGEGMDDYGDDMDDDDEAEQYAQFTGQASGDMVVTPPNNSAAMDEHLSYSQDPRNMTNPVSIEQYQADLAQRDATIKRMATHHRQLTEQVALLNAQRADAERSAALTTLCNQYPQLNYEAEASRMLYSHGSTMNDETFRSEIARIEQYAHQFSMHNNTIPAGSLQGHMSHGGQNDRSTELFSQQGFQEECQRIQTEAANRGEFYPWNTLVAKTKESLAAQQGPPTNAVQ